METLLLKEKPKTNLNTGEYSAIIEGKEFKWTKQEMDRGLDAFSDEEYNQIIDNLLSNKILSGYGEVTTENIAQISQGFLEPYISKDGKGKIMPDEKAIVMHFASRALSFLETDKQKLLKGERPGGYDIDISDRSTILAKPGDVIIRRGDLLQKRLDMGDKVLLDSSNFQDENKIKAVDASNLNFYHTSDALLYEAQKREQGEESKIDLLVEFLAQNPDSLIRLYTNDTPTQIFLLYLLQEAKEINPEINKLRVEANSPEISKLNRKDVMYPNINKIQNSLLTLPVGQAKFKISNLNWKEYQELNLSERNKIKAERYEILSKEAKLSELGSWGVYDEIFNTVEKNNEFKTYAPGYSVIFNDRMSKDEYINQVIQARDRLKDVYGLEKVCFKWSTASDGENTIPNILNDENGEKFLIDLADKAWEAKQSVCVVSSSNYLKSKDGRNINLTPSAHILGGYAVKDTITEQTTQGQKWIGNTTLSKKDFLDLAGTDVNEREKFEQIFDTIIGINQSIGEVLRPNGIAMAGNDFGIFTLGGVFEDDVFVNIQDNNWRFTGANLAYSANEIAKKYLSNENNNTITRVISVSDGYGPQDFKNYFAKFNNNYDKYAFADIVTITPGWSMIYVSSIGDTSETRSLMNEVIIKELNERGMLKQTS